MQSTQKSMQFQSNIRFILNLILIKYKTKDNSKGSRQRFRLLHQTFMLTEQ